MLTCTDHRLEYTAKLIDHCSLATPHAIIWVTDLKIERDLRLISSHSGSVCSSSAKVPRTECYDEEDDENEENENGGNLRRCEVDEEEREDGSEDEYEEQEGKVAVR